MLITTVSIAMLASTITAIGNPVHDVIWLAVSNCALGLALIISQYPPLPRKTPNARS